MIQGPYYLNFYDPSYVYLINALNLSQLNGYGVGHFDHPGTTVQTLGAVAVKMFYLFSGSNADISNDVLSRPEAYLFFMNKFFVILNCIALLFLGFFTLKITDNILLSILIQLSPFASTEIFYGLIIVTPENLLIFFLLLLISSLIYYLYRVNPESKTSLKLIFVWGIICGGGLVTKLNFIPVILIPFFLIKGFKGKILFTLFSILTFFLLFSPALSNFGNFLAWIEKLFINNGRYGDGDATIINENTFLKNIGMIFTKDLLYLFSYVFSFTMLLLNKFKKISFQSTEDGNEFKKRIKLLFLIFISMNVQILMVAKHYSQYYMIPSFMLAVLTILISSQLLNEYLKFFSVKINRRFLPASLILIISLFSFYKIVYSYYEGDEQRSEAEKVFELVNSEYPKGLVISSFGSANPDCALAFAVQYAAGQKETYDKIIFNKQKSHIYFNPWSNRIYSSQKKDDVKKQLSESKKIFLQINSYSSVDLFSRDLESNYGKKIISSKNLITNGNGESVYEIVLEQ